MFGYNRLCGVFEMLINSFFVEQAERFRLKVMSRRHQTDRWTHTVINDR